MKKVFITALVIVVVGVLAFLGYILYDNSRIATVEYEYVSQKVPQNFDGYRIGFVTDFHNSGNYDKIHKAFTEAQPDIICVVGDLVDMNTVDFTNSLNLMERLTQVADVYYVYGNHEFWGIVENNTQTNEMTDKIKEIGVHLLNDSVKTIEKDGQLINLIGYGDCVYDDSNSIFEEKAKDKITRLYNTLDKTVLSVLLFHRGQYFDMIADVGYDVVLSGHLHGGIVNINGIRERVLNKHFGTDKYVKGVYKAGDSTMYMSAGVAGRKNLPRVFNTAEINILELKSK